MSTILHIINCFVLIFYSCLMQNSSILHNEDSACYSSIDSCRYDFTSDNSAHDSVDEIDTNSIIKTVDSLNGSAENPNVNDCSICCNNNRKWYDWLLDGLSVAGVIFAALGIWQSKCQFNENNKAAQDSFNSYKEESLKLQKNQIDNLCALQEQTKAIVKLTNNSQKAEIVAYFSKCYPLIHICYDYLSTKISDFLNGEKEANVFVFNTIVSLVENASALQILLKEEQNRYDEDFIKALGICVGMQNFQAKLYSSSKRRQVANSLINDLILCQEAFDKQKTKFS